MASGYGLVSTFWRPVALGQGHTWGEAPLKRLGSGAYELWCRCDLCSWSGPLGRFVRFHKGPDMSTLCDGCTGDEGLVKTMQAEGWTVCG